MLKHTRKKAKEIKEGIVHDVPILIEMIPGMIFIIIVKGLSLDVWFE